MRSGVQWGLLKCTLGLAASSARLGCGGTEEPPPIPGVQRQRLAAPITVTFQNGAAPAASYAGTTDATIRQASASSNFGNVTTCRVDGDEGGGADLACLLRWNATSIPIGSMIQSASITLRALAGTTQTYGLYPVLRSWNESEVTWQRSTTSSTWQIAGAKGSTDRGDAIGTITGSGSVTVALNAGGIALQDVDQPW